MNKVNARISGVAVRRSHERGHANHGWLDSYHTFSFAGYQDPRHMGFRSLRVINEDFVDPGKGFGTHPHRDMEIITYVISGSLEHKDSMGTGSVIRPGDVQKMSAGIGVEHSEYNPSRTEKVHLLQIWIVPRERGIKPFYQQISCGASENGLTLIGSGSPRDNAVLIHQDAELFRGVLGAGEEVRREVRPGRGIWAQMIKGKAELNGQPMSAGDGAAVENVPQIVLRTTEAAEFLVFDLG